jgi:hypothetical protein
MLCGLCVWDLRLLLWPLCKKMMSVMCSSRQSATQYLARMYAFLSCLVGNSCVGTNVAVVSVQEDDECDVF